MFQREFRCQQPDASTSGRDQLYQSCSSVRSSSRRKATRIACSGQKEVTLLDYGAGNVRSVRNAILKLGYTLKEVRYLLEAGGMEHPCGMRHPQGHFHSFHQFLPSSRHRLLQVSSPKDIMAAEKLIFPGVGAFEQAMGVLRSKEFTEPLREYIQANDTPHTMK